ncbi:MAG TPA: alpha/beta hydrolase [Allocoleopsis sp.]
MNKLFRNSKMKVAPGQIYWREIGEKNEAIIFIHNSFSDSNEWIPLLEIFGQNYHCFAVDLLGFGSSDLPEIHYSIELQVEVLAEFLNTLNLQDIYLVGHGLGGWVTASFALHNQENIKGVVLISPMGSKYENERKYAEYNFLISAPNIFFIALEKIKSVAKLLGLNKKIEEILEKRKLLMRNPTSCELLFARPSAEIKAELLGDKLGLLKIPVLLLQGLNSPGQCEDYAQMLAQATLHTVNFNEQELLSERCEIMARYIEEFILNNG